MANAFTTTNSRITNSLKNEAEVRYDGKAITVNALWDTGATSSCISNEVVKSLSMMPTGVVRVMTPSGDAKRGTYLVDIVLPSDVLVEELQVVDSEIGAQGIGLLIGMDIITKGDFAVSNHGGKTVFTFRIPSERTTDYVKQIQAQNIIGPTHGRGPRKKRKR